MATRPPQVEADEVAMVTVRLSQVPLELRAQAAQVLIRKEGLNMIAALLMAAAAESPIEDPSLEVPADKAHLVLEEGRFPAGPFPVFG